MPSRQSWGLEKELYKYNLLVETQLQFESKSFLPTTTVSFVDEDETTSHLDKKLLNFDLDENEKP